MLSKEEQDALKQAVASLLDNAPLNTVVEKVSWPQKDSSLPITLLHVRFNEDVPQIPALARFLWRHSVNYALSRRRRIEFNKQLADGDLTVSVDIVRAVQDVFIEFRTKYPSRASEVGEVLAYCIAVHYLGAAQMMSKMSLKTSSNMPVHGLDGIHAAFENEALTIYFLESKLAKTANDGAREYAESVSGFVKNEKQYLREYELVGDLGNFDTLEGDARELALQHFDVIGKPELPRRERSIGIVCYSEKKHFSNKIPISNGPLDAHEKHFANLYAQEGAHHQAATLKHLQSFGAKPEKCMVFFVAVPDVNVLREEFYKQMRIDGK